MTERPDHPDFWLIAEAVQDFDAAAEDRGLTIERIISSTVDADSLFFVSEQRVQRMVRSGLVAQDAVVAAQAAWLDAFVAGALYQKRKTERGQANG